MRFFERTQPLFYIQSMTTTTGYDRNDRYSQAKKAIDALRKLKQELGDKTLNEAETRHSFINSIIHDVMGWPKTLAVRTERKVGDSGIYDYRLDDSNTIGLMIIEAKKEGNYFDIDEKREINADRLRTKGTNKAFFAAVEQAVNYARQLTIPYAMVCNGHQVAVVASVAQRGKPDELGKAIIFKSLDDISEHLEEFLELFSFPELILPVPKLHNAITIRKTGIAAGAHVFKYSLPKYPRPFVYSGTTSDTLKAKEDEIKNICSGIIHGIDASALRNQKLDEFLEHCYVTPSDYETSQREESTRGERKAFTREFYNEVDIQAEAAITRKGVNTSLLDFAPQEPIIILGNVGVGKSIFIDYLMYKERTYLSRAYVARVNFKNVSTLTKEDIEAAVATEICAAMYRGGYDCKDKGKLSDIYAKEVSEIKSYYKGAGEEKIKEKVGDLLLNKSMNMKQLVKDSLIHIKRDPTKKKSIVFLDNVDQKQTSLQREIYAFAREIMDQWGVDVSVVTMTPVAFHNARYDRTERSPRSIGHTKVYTVIGPPVSSILQKRIDFIQTLYKEERLPQYGYDFSVQNTTAYDYLSVLKRELAPQMMISTYMESLSGGNIREVIDMLQVYILSPWTKVVKWKPKTNTYEVFDEVTRSHFLRAILKNNALDYDSETNQFIINLFSLNEMDPREHFLSLAILHKMKTVTPSGSTYHSMKDILEWGRSYGFSDQQVFNKILELEAGKLVEPIDLAAHSDETMEGMATSYRIRPRGNFHFELASDCGYIEEMAKVTPILSQEVSHYELNKETGIEANVNNAERFYQYLISIYREQNIEDEFLPRHVLAKLRSSITNVKNSMKKVK